jgi:hypothetical protein
MGSLNAMRRELTRVMQTAGYEVGWRGPQDSNIETSAFLAVVELRGDCEAPTLPAGATVSTTADLASTYVSDGHVLPFSWVNCGNVTRLLAPALVDQSGARADFILGRAFARLIAHEFYHMLMQTREHTGNGISKPCFTAGELLAERFEFEHSALAELQHCPMGRALNGAVPQPAAIDAEDAGKIQ